MSEPIFSVLNGKPCGITTHVCNSFGNWSDDIPWDCFNNCPGGRYVQPDVGGNDPSPSLICGPCTSSNVGEVCHMSFICS